MLRHNIKKLFRILGVFCGFNPKFLNKLTTTNKIKIGLFNLWSLFSIFICAASTSYLIYSSKENILISLLCFIFLSLILWSFHTVLITSSCIELDTDKDKIGLWKPSLTRSLVFLLIGLFFSQPVIFSFETLFNNSNTNNSLTSLIHQEKIIDARFNHYISEKKQKKTQKELLINLIDSDSENLSNQYSKKALIIENDNSNDKKSNPLIKELTDLNFSVTYLNNLKIKDFEFELRKFKDSLKNSDISLIIFEGKVLTSNSKNYILPTDFNNNLNEAIDLNNLILSANSNQLLSSLYIFNIQTNSNLIYKNFLTNFKTPKENLILITQITKVNEIEKIIIKNLSSKESLKEIFLKIKNEISNKSYNIKFIDKLTIPIFMNGRPKLQNTTLNKPYSKKLLPESEYCSIYQSFDSALLNCLNAEISIINNEVMFLNNLKNREFQKFKDLKINKKSKPNVVLNYFSSIKNHKLTTFFFTLIAIIILSGGFLFREHSYNLIKDYENLNYRHNRLEVLLNFREFREKTELTRNLMKKNNEYFDFLKNLPQLIKFQEKEYKINKSKEAAKEFYMALKKQLSNKTSKTQID